ncbi:NPC intracellular cholesterol transporter 2-like [Dreissena polymorpha]|uniref:NPC intracellular cholesterol transporter 2-like n=1 Tax=Dreissena polymorpha TaxID=45954 RepID=UPI0022649A3E|nr:NPC intracellular cholesterol transporter 2-like [Dreissena polymorpha]
MYRLVVLAAAVALATAEVILTLHDCGSHDSIINSVRVEQCDSEPCIVHKGQDYTVHVNFTATRTVQEAHNVLHGGLGFISAPFPLQPENACQGSVTCPIVAGQTYEYVQTMTCPTFAPSITVTAKWEVKDENKQDIFCFNTRLQIKS